MSAVELELFTESAKHPEDAETLRGRLGLHRRSSLDFLDALVSLGFLERHGATYPTRRPHLFLDKRKPSYLGGILEMANYRLYGFWGHLTEALRTGQLQNEAMFRGTPFFEAIYADPARLKQFLAAMTRLSHGANLAIATRFPWNEHGTFARHRDRAGRSRGADRAREPSPHGRRLRPSRGCAPFEEYVEHNALQRRLRFVAGDFFADDLPNVDVLTMGHILHDWNLDEKRALIGKAYEALPDGGALIVYDSIIDDDRSKNAFGLLMGLNMLIETEGGFDYTAEDCIGWMGEAGFTTTRAEHLIGPDSMVIAIK